MKNIRERLSIILSIYSMIFMGFVLIKYGEKVEILTLLIGFITGSVVSSIFGVYFNSSHKEKQDLEQVNNNQDGNNTANNQ